MGKQVILILQGGGALGAYECGVYKALAPYFRANGHEIAVIGGASIGALNGALIARHCLAPDGGVAALESFWRQAAHPSVKMFPVESYLGRWAGLLWNMALGNPALYHPNPVSWTPAGAAIRFQQALFDPAPMRRTLSTHFGGYGPNPGQAPLLVVKTQDAERGEAAVFNSWHGEIDVDQLVASTAIPLCFPAQKVADRYCWDGEMGCTSALREVLEVLQSAPDPDWVASSYLVVMVDLLPRGGDIPESDLAISYRIMGSAFGNKPESDRRAAELFNRYLELVEDLHAAAEPLPASPLKARIAAEREQLSSERRVRLDFMTIRRAALPHEHISRDFDYSAERLDALIAQGYADAQRVLRERDAGERPPIPPRRHAVNEAHPAG